MIRTHKEKNSLSSFDPFDYGDLFGSSLSSAGDVNGDGLDNYLIGAYGADLDLEYQKAGKVFLYGLSRYRKPLPFSPLGEKVPIGG